MAAGKPGRVLRPCNWGVLVIGDAENSGLPQLSRDGSITSSATQIVVPVRHAQDVSFSSEAEEIVPFAVSVEFSAGVAQGKILRFDGILDIPSGRLAIGDADGAEIIHLPPGPVRVQVAVEPVDHAERVEVWYSSVV